MRNPKLITSLVSGLFIVSSFSALAMSDKNLYVFWKNKKAGFIDSQGKVQVPATFESVCSDFSEELCQVQQDNKWGYINKKGNIVIKPQFNKANDFSNGLAGVGFGKKKQMWGFVDEMGKIVINPKFSEVKDFSEGLAAVKEGDKWGYINELGNYFLKPKLSDAGIFSEGLAPVYNTPEAWSDQLNKKRGQNKASNAGVYNSDVFEGNTTNYKGYGYLDKKGRVIIKPKYDKAMPFHNGLAVVKEGDKWGYINRKGQYVVQPQFDEAYDFSEGIAKVKVSDNYGFINRLGKFIVNPIYDEANDFSEGLAGVKTDGKFGYINISGKFIIEPQFFKVTDFKKGLARVDMYSGYQGDYYYVLYIDKSGEPIIRYNAGST